MVANASLGRLLPSQLQPLRVSGWLFLSGALSGYSAFSVSRGASIVRRRLMTCVSAARRFLFSLPVVSPSSGDMFSLLDLLRRLEFSVLVRVRARPQIISASDCIRPSLVLATFLLFCLLLELRGFARLLVGRQMPLFGRRILFLSLSGEPLQGLRLPCSPWKCSGIKRSGDRVWRRFPFLNPQQLSHFILHKKSGFSKMEFILLRMPFCFCALCISS